METSLRFSGESSDLDFSTDRNPKVRNALKIHAKQKFPFSYANLLQVTGDIDTGAGAPTFFSAFIRHFYPDLKASLGAGLQYDRQGKLNYCILGKKLYPVTPDQSVNVVIKGRCDYDRGFQQPKPSAAVEFVWNILNFQEDQDLRLKFGYEVVDKIPYVQIRENNWALNADFNGKWSVNYYL